ncbi:MAG: glutaredoxin family protein [Azospira oryzae]|nr:MAG: glutaredoxin family protein [Azospira oryzae]PZP81824.1 MAG: glutaredoxin family protein [Azospira oryzae]
MRSLTVAILLLTVSAVAAQQTLYRWVDEKGRVHYTDVPPPASAKEKEAKKMGGGAGSTALPFAVRQAASRYPVTLYAGDCGEPCDLARQLLEERGIPYTEKDGRLPAEQAELKKLAGALEVPVLKVGSQVIKGFEASQWHLTLDAAGYPRELPPALRARAGKPPAAPPEKPASSPAAQPPPAETLPGQGQPTAQPTARGVWLPLDAGSE